MPDEKSSRRTQENERNSGRIAIAGKISGVRSGSDPA